MSRRVQRVHACCYIVQKYYCKNDKNRQKYGTKVPNIYFDIQTIQMLNKSQD